MLSDGDMFYFVDDTYPDSKVHGANMRPTWTPCWPREPCYQGSCPSEGIVGCDVSSDTLVNTSPVCIDYSTRLQHWGTLPISQLYARSYTNTVLLQWRQNERDGVSNHQPHNCLLNCLISRGSKKVSKVRVTGLCVGNSPVTDGFPAKMSSNAKKCPFDDVIMYSGKNHPFVTMLDILINTCHAAASRYITTPVTVYSLGYLTIYPYLK